MRVLPLRRRGSVGTLSDRRTYARIYVLGLLAVAAALVLFLVSEYGPSSSPQPSGSRRLDAGHKFSFISRAFTHRHTRPSKHEGPVERFAAVFHSELAGRFKFAQHGNESALVGDLVDTLKQMEKVGITTVIFSSPWDWFQAKEGAIRYDYLDTLVEAACQNTQLKVAFILDMVRVPAWVFTRWPDAKSMDSHGREYQLLSWFHRKANHVALQVLVDVVTHLVNRNGSCVTAVQPVYNNEYEARYTQEHDCYQDYSPPARVAFRQWLQARRPRLDDINSRWGSSYQKWDEVEPLVLEAGSVSGPDFTIKYWDFIKFRETYGAGVLTRACSAIQASGARCFHHVPELFNVMDAVYGTTMFKHIASSASTDFIIVDSNFVTTYGTGMNPSKLRLNIAAAQSYGKPVFFEAALERSPGLDTLAVGMRHALAAGADGVGVSNWLGIYEMGETLGATLYPAVTACKVTEVVGLFIHLDSCAAFHGLQWQWFRKDPINDFVQDLADSLSAKCGTYVSLHLELDRFYSALPSLDRIIFVEPLVLHGAAELDMYLRVKSAIQELPNEVLRLPVDNTRGVQMMILEEL